jgi:hypothetical protein
MQITPVWRESFLARLFITLDALDIELRWTWQDFADWNTIWRWRYFALRNTDIRQDIFFIKLGQNWLTSCPRHFLRASRQCQTVKVNAALFCTFFNCANFHSSGFKMWWQKQQWQIDKPRLLLRSEFIWALWHRLKFSSVPANSSYQMIEATN